MGRPEGPRCYCYVNNLLRKSLDDVARNYEALVLDNEAGMEHLSRRTTNNVDFLLAVLTPTMPALRAVKRILTLSRELPIRIAHRAVLVNCVGPDGLSEQIAGELGPLDAQRLPDVPLDSDVERAGAVGEDVFRLPEQSPALRAVDSVVAALCATLTAGNRLQ
jgi:CO dehydrogenase maturation factor